MKRDIRLVLYTDYPSSSLDTDYISDKLSELGFLVEKRGNLVEYLSLSEKELYELARDLSSTYISDIESPLESPNTQGLEIEQEINKLKGSQSTLGKFYDALWMQRILYRLLFEKVPGEIASNEINLIFTSRLFGTFEQRRYHARVVLMGAPSLISTSGLVEAPAKPREYYYVRGRLIQSGMDTSELESMYEGRFVRYDDTKISSILVSYALQVIGYEMTGSAFCNDPGCCLTNSHWQEEVLKVQYEGTLCDKCKINLKIT
ncbi:MAG: DUF6775 family putative metallopeptidase [Thermodesulfobacteriota bacterium]